MATPIFKATATEVGNADRILGMLPIQLRRKVLKAALRKSGTVVAREARRIVPYDKTRKEGRHSRNTISTKTKQYGNTVAAFIGPRYGPGLGNHSHLVEFGHVIRRKTPGPTFTRPKPFMRPAADTTLPTQKNTIISHLKSHLKTVR